MPYLVPKYLLYETLRSTPSAGMTIETGVPFEFSELITEFKSRIPGGAAPAPAIVPVPGPLAPVVPAPVLPAPVLPAPVAVDPTRALKYSAYVRSPTPKTGYVFMVGWDHAITIRKGPDGFYANAIYSGSYASGNSDTWAYRIPDRGMGAPIDMAPPRLTLVTNGRRYEWAKYDLSALNLRIDRLITFSITSCSFAVLYDAGADNILVSHMAFAPPIPLAWLARTELAARDDYPMTLLASINSTPGELRKFLSTTTFPLVNELNVEPVMITRGPRGLVLPNPDDTPFMTHPYLGLDFASLEAIYFQGALGYNNDTTRGFREFPPFHSILSKFYPAFMRGTDAAAILAAARSLKLGEHGFGTLHALMLVRIQRADETRTRAGNPYTSTKLTALLAATKGGILSSPTAPVPRELTGVERAVFLLAELTASPDAPNFAWIKDEVFAAWDAYQMRFSLDMNRVDRWSVLGA